MRQILTAFNKHFGATLGAQEITGKNEFEAMINLLTKINIRGEIITADAAFCHEEILDLLQNSPSAGNLCVEPVLESSRTYCYAATRGSVSPLNSLS